MLSRFSSRDPLSPRRPAWARRGACATLTALVALWLTACDKPVDRRLTILQINDVYRIEGLEDGNVGGLARLRTLRKSLEAQGPVLFLHGGDALFPSVASKYFSGEQMVDCLNSLDGDPDGFDPNLILTFGNHEFDGDADVFTSRVQQSDFRWVTTNISYRASPTVEPVAFDSLFPNVPRWLVVEVGDLRVGLFSITLDAAERDYLHYTYAPRDARNALVRTAIDELREDGIDLLVALTHQSLSDDSLLAEDFPEIDLIVGGHDHIAQEERVGDTLITKADADAKTAYVIDVELSGDGVVKTTAERRPIDATIDPDPALRQQAERWLSRLAEQIPGFAEVVGATEHLLGGEEPLIRGAESAMGNWLTDVVRQDLATDIGLIQGGAVRINENIPAGGEIRGEHLEGIFYYDDQVVSFEVSGAQIVDMLNNSVSRVAAGDGRFLQVSGLEFTYHPVPPQDGRQVEAENVRVRRHSREVLEPLDPAASYTIATLRHLWANGARYGYEGFAADIVVDGTAGSSPALLPDGEAGPRQWRALTTDWLRRQGRVTVGIEGRIVPLAAEPGTSQPQAPTQRGMTSRSPG